MKLHVVFLVLTLRETFQRGIHNGGENDSPQLTDDYETKPNSASASASAANPLQMHVDNGNVQAEVIDSSRRNPGLERGGSVQFETDDKSRRQHANGRQYQSANVSVEYVPAKDNGTWKVEKQDKTIELSREVLETQHATCQITTEELVATAQATVTRVLKGLCNSKEMGNHFHNMEIILSNQLNLIKDMIINIENRILDQEEKILRSQKQLLSAMPKNCGVNSNPATFLPINADLERKPTKLSSEIRDFTELSGSRIRQQPIELDEYDESEEELNGARDAEILKYNSSIHMEASLNGPPKKVFTYYWKIRHMHYKLTGWSSRRSLRSQSFYIFPNGYRMYLRIYPRQNDENFYVHVGVTKGDFDDTLKWPFPLKHKVHILDQTKEGRTFEDIASRIWDPNQLCSEFNWQKPTKGDNYECVGLGFPHDVLRQRDYIREDAIIIKLTVYLES